MLLTEKPYLIGTICYFIYKILIHNAYIKLQLENQIVRSFTMHPTAAIYCLMHFHIIETKHIVNEFVYNTNQSIVV